MKQQSLSISIPEPCHEKWSEMSPVEKGRHCKSCQKTVVDFTRMPKVEIAEFVAENKGNVCGRFSTDQLNAELFQTKSTKSWLKYATIILGLIPSLGYGQEVFAQKPSDPPLHQDIRGKIRLENQMPTQTPNQKIRVFGTVVDQETKEAILFASIEIYQGHNKFMELTTDIDGEFDIAVPVNVYFKVSYFGYEDKIIQFQDLIFDDGFQITLQENSYPIMGIVMIEQPEAFKTIEKHEKIIASKKITGRLIDRNGGIKLPFASVLIYLNGILDSGLETDDEGRFDLEIPEGASLEVSYIGYETLEIDYQNIPTKEELVISLKTKLLEATELITGEYVVEEGISSQDQNNQEPENMILLPTIEILGYEIPAIKGLISCETTTTISSDICFSSQLQESWLESAWKKFKSWIVTGRQEAQANKEISTKLRDRDLEFKKPNSNVLDSFENVPTVTNPTSQNSKLQHTNVQTAAKVCPNPSTGRFNIEIPIGFQKFFISVTNIKNETIIKQNSSSFDGIIDLSSFETGSYIISIISEGNLIASTVVMKI